MKFSCCFVAACVVALALSGCDSVTTENTTMAPTNDSISELADSDPAAAPYSTSLKTEGTLGSLSETGGCSESEEVESVEVNETRYWIGVCSEHAPDAVLCQLGIKCGVLVNQVFSQGPSSGRLEKHDVIFQLDGKPIRCARTLANCINDIGDKDISISVIRNGKIEEVTVRPQLITQVGNQIIQFTHVADSEKMMAAIPITEHDLNDPTKEIDMFVFRPGMQLDIGGQTRPANPCQGDLQLEMLVSFRETSDGLVALVRQGNQITEYNKHNINQACLPVQALMQHVVGVGQYSEE